jgi:hypothetical protein
VNPGEALLSLRSLGGNLFLASGRVRYRAPRGALPEALRAELAAHRDELAEILRTERMAEVTRLLDAAYRRLNTLGPWTPPEACAFRDLGEAVDAAGRTYIAGAGDLPIFEAAVQRWEGALSADRVPLPRSCPCGSVVIREENDGVRICGHCRRELGSVVGGAEQ